MRFKGVPYRGGCSLWAFCFLLMLSCSVEERDSSFEVRNFEALTQGTDGGKKLQKLSVDLSSGPERGFVIPSSAQRKGGRFHFQFEVKDPDPEAPLYYKIFYRNKSYSFPLSKGGRYNPLAGENFYGSWQDNELSMKKMEVPDDGSYHQINGTFRIVGNPRNEEKYKGDGQNHRWKRNPRVGTYEFWILVARKKGVVPNYIRNIGLKGPDTNFRDPAYYCFKGKGKDASGVKSLKANTLLKAKAELDPMDGIYVSDRKSPNPNDSSHFCETCGRKEHLEKEADFAQFEHHVSGEEVFQNIPLIHDPAEKKLTPRHYDHYRSFTSQAERVKVSPTVASASCQTVKVDEDRGGILLKNPPSKPGERRKEQVGIISRLGISYGTFRVKADLTELLNEHGVWNGLTNAVWLAAQSSKPWNERRPCGGEKGYQASYYGGKDDERVEQVSYSEIDFEIIKTQKRCPANRYPPVTPTPLPDQKDRNAWDVTSEDPGDERMITVACTNWDMACDGPEDFDVGCHQLRYRDRSFSSHRWSKAYRAVTQMEKAPHDSLFGRDHYFFEIRWKPKSIEWRIGPEPDRMRTVAYMDESMTSIPGNQMNLLITQEYHKTEWWPGAIFEQKNVPFSAKAFEGVVQDVTIE